MTESPTTTTSRRGPLKTGLYLALTLLVLGGSVLALLRVRPAEVWGALTTVDAIWLIPAFVAMAAGVFVRGLRWRALFNPAGRPSIAAVTDATLVGYFFNTILPARAGEAARVVSLNRRSSASASEISATVILAGIYDVLGLLVIFLVASPFLPPTIWLQPAATLALVLAIGLVGTAATLALFGERPLVAVLRPLHRLPGLSAERLEAVAKGLAHGMAGLRSTRVALEATVWTFLAWGFTGLSCWLVMLGFHLDLVVAAGLLIAVAGGLAMVLPSPPSAIGVFEASVVLALAIYDVSPSRALSYALLVHALNIVPFLIVGPLVIWHESRIEAAKTASSSGEPPPGADPSWSGARGRVGDEHVAPAEHAL